MPFARPTSLAVLLLCLALSACAGKRQTAAAPAADSLFDQAAVKPLTQPVDLAYRPVCLDVSSTQQTRSDNRTTSAEFFFRHEVREKPGADGLLILAEPLETVSTNGRVVSTEGPLALFRCELTPKGEVRGHIFDTTGLERIGLGKDSPFVRNFATSIQSSLAILRLPDPPVAQGDTLYLRPTALYLPASRARQYSGPQSFPMRVVGRGVLRGREVLAVQGRATVSFIHEQTGLELNDLHIAASELYDLSTMALIRSSIRKKTVMAGTQTVTLSTTSAETCASAPAPTLEDPAKPTLHAALGLDR